VGAAPQVAVVARAVARRAAFALGLRIERLGDAALRIPMKPTG
jgi:hypothetical protein